MIFRKCIRFIVALASVLPLGACSPQAHHALAEPKDDKSIAWRFVDSRDPKALQHKNDTIAAIDRFWHTFTDKNPELLKSIHADNSQLGNQVSWLANDLNAVNDHLMWEVTPRLPDGRSQLVITTEGHHDLQVIVDTMLQRAPKLPGWQFVGYCDRLRPDQVEQGVQKRYGEKVPSFSADVTVSPANKINVVMLSPTFKKDNQEDDIAVAVGLCDVAIGEEIMDKWIGTIRTRKGNVPSADVALSAKKLADDVDKAQQAVINKLPEKPLYSLKAPEETAIIKNSNPSADIRRLTMASWNRPFLASVVDSSFCSERLSHVGEQFCYLKAMDAGEKATPDGRTSIEQALDDALRKKKLGCIIATGWGPPSTLYLDLCLADVNASIPVLREVCQSSQLPHTTWLQFYDQDWNGESVRMFDDTPNSLEPNEVW